MDDFLTGKVDVNKIIRAIEEDRIKKLIKGDGIPLLGQVDGLSKRKITKNYAYSVWKNEKGFGRKKAKLLSVLSFEEYTSNSFLAKKTDVEGKNLTSLVSQVNTELKKKGLNIHIISNKRKSRKLEVLDTAV